MLKVLFIGLGSIGQRHIRNIREVYGDRVELYAYRVRKSNITFSKDMKIREGVNVEQEYNIHGVDSLEQAWQIGMDIVFITTITAKHMEYALAAAAAGCNLFIEKPLCDSLKDIDKLKNDIESKKLIVYLGYQNRKHRCIQELRKVIKEGCLGQIIFIDACFCERITTMHTYEDYKTTYMARKELGGGCLLNLQIHDIDYLQWIFGVPERIYASLNYGSNLGIDVEDASILQYQADKLGYLVSVTSRADFFQYPPTHKCIVVGENGRFEMDFNNNYTHLYLRDNEPIVNTFDHFERNDMFIEEMREFFDCVKKKIQPECSLDDGINGVKIVEAAKKSFVKKEITYV